MNGKYKSQSGNIVLNAVLIILVIIVVAAVLFPVLRFAFRNPQTSYGSRCQPNLKELGIALRLYINDYDGMLPSSVVNGSKKWNPITYKQFATKRGATPPLPNSRNATLAMLLYPFMKNKDVIWCPYDPDRKDDPNATISYWYKAAIDAAWFGGPSGKGPKYQKYDDFRFQVHQIVFYEHAGWHHKEQNKGLTNGVSINCCFMDGHVRRCHIISSTNPPGKADPLAPGEPGWFNADFTKPNPTGKVYSPSDELAWNPQKGGDSLK